MEKYYWAALGAAKGIGRKDKIRLAGFFGSIREVFSADRSGLMASGLFTPAGLTRFLAARDTASPERIAEACSRSGVRVVSYEDGEYPAALRHTVMPPLALYVRGRLPDCRCSIGIVGSRKATPYGLKVSGLFGRELAEAGVTIISGGARGVDTAAHEGALAAGGKTVAVLGCGPDVAYPAVNRNLFQRIAEEGALVSEYPPGSKPLAFHFPERNRIISGMARGVFLVEGARKSGALITAEFAMDEGREVFCLPGSIFFPHSEGPHSLIKSGAKLADSPRDILEELFPSLQGNENSRLFPPGPVQKAVPRTEEETVLLDRLTKGPQSLEQLAEGCGWDPARLSTVLLRLQLEGAVEQDATRLYHRF